jgi:ribose/xylose/arabinose/galactoside ABC-type transport system permease subunit
MNQVSTGAPGEMLPPVKDEPQHHKKGITLGDYTERFALIIAWVVVIVVFSILAPDSFFRLQNFTTILGTQTTLVILSLAVLIPLIAGDYDLSLAANLMMAGMLVAVLNAKHGVPLSSGSARCSASSTGSSSSSSTSMRSS